MVQTDRLLDPKLIGGFTAIVAIFTAYQLALNFQAYRFSWACWDYMLISANGCFIAAMILVLSLTRRFDAALRQLRLNNVLMMSDDDVADLKDRIGQRARPIELISGWLIGAVVLGSFIFVFGEFMATVWSAWRSNRLSGGGWSLVEFGFFVVISVLAAGIAGLFFGRLARYGMLASVLSDNHEGLRVIPGHFDGACGLKPIGDFYLYQALLLAIPILWLGAWWAWVIPQYQSLVCSVTQQPQMLFAEWRGPFFMQWLVVLGYFCMGFVRPFYQLRRRIRTTRLALVRDETPRLEQEILARHDRTATLGQVHTASLDDDHERLSRRLWSINTMGDWPMDSTTLAKYRSLLLGEVLLPLGAYLVPRIGNLL
ncbi:MAG: hypothetical protein ABL904_12855 [Hyphomicrobiaceae bacterium]